MEAKNLRSTDRESGRIAPLNIPIEYSDLQEHRTSEQQRIWTKTIADGPFKRSPYYKKIAVLTLSFHRDFDDLGDGVQSEIDNLSSLFRESFNYPVENFELRPEEDAQVIINARVAKFVCDNRGPDTLLIVYYAGHGRPGTNHGELVVFKFVGMLLFGQRDLTLVQQTTQSLQLTNQGSRLGPNSGLEHDRDTIEISDVRCLCDLRLVSIAIFEPGDL